MTEKQIKTVEVSYDEFTDPDFIAPGTFYVMDAFGTYIFYKTSDRMKAQEQADKTYGKGKYKVVASKILATKSKLESGGYSVRGTATRQVRR